MLSYVVYSISYIAGMGKMTDHPANDIRHTTYDIQIYLKIADYEI